jgi:hypothetical protein
MSQLKIPALIGIVSMFMAGCGGQEQDWLGTRGGDDLTSKSAVERNLTIKGHVYVDKTASSYSITSAVKRQIRSAFGPLRIAKISVDDRELKNNIDSSTFVSETVDVVKKSGSGGGGTDTGTDLTVGGVNAKGVVKLCNDTAITTEILDDQVGLASTAAKNIAAGRPYTTITEVDKTWGIGNWSLQRLLTYAKANNYVDGGGSSGVTVVKTVKKVSYTYKARALVVKSQASKSSFSLALLMGNYQSFVNEIIHDCVEDYAHDSEFSSSFWYVFAPAESKCKQRIANEVSAIQSERQGLGPKQIGEKEHARRFLPVTAQLESVAAPKTTWPEYDQLYGLADAAKKRIKVYQIVGVASHAGDPAAERFENDLGFKEFFKTVKVLDDKYTTLRVADSSPCKPGAFSYNGKTYGASLKQLYQWVVSRSGFPSEISYADRGKFLRALHDHVNLKWIKLEADLQVHAGHVHKQMTLEINLIFGTASGYSVRGYFRTAFKNGDVVLYDGHSYIGSGPLDPNNYSASDFANRYQIFFFNSCVSYNYYGVDYFDLKSGASQQLDLVNNGIEVYIRDGGKSMGQFIVALFDGKQHSWLTVLEKTQVSIWYGVHDPNRAVDGEQDNTYSPSTTPIAVKEGTTTVSVDNTTTACGGAVSGTIQLSATASTGANRVEFWAGGVRVASDNSAPYAASWDSTSAANGSLSISTRAYDGSGNYHADSCSVTVQNGGGSVDLFDDDMESGGSNWTATGLWAMAQSGSCATPAYASAVSAWYFGQSASCNYKTGSATKGTLTSRAISGVTAASKLSFKFWRGVESHSGGGYDKTLVQVSLDGASSWKTVWSRDCKDASGKAWKSSGAISLAEFAGKSIRVRFSFDSVDDYANDHVGWMIDDVLVSR